MLKMRLLKRRYEKLTWAICNDYCDRKRAGVLCLVYNTKEKIFYPVPRDVEHVDFVAALFGVSDEELKYYASHIIPVTIIIETDFVVGLTIGVSGM